MRIETERLVLRESEDDDLDAIMDFAADPEVIRFVEWGPNDAAMTRDVLRSRQEEARAVPRTSFELAMTLKASGELIGSCGLRLSEPSKRAGDIGYVLNRRFWGRGYASEAARAMIGFGFRECGLHRIWATCAPDNVGSRRVMEKCGMRHEGTLRGHLLCRGAWRDSVLYAILETDRAA